MEQPMGSLAGGASPPDETIPPPKTLSRPYIIGPVYDNVFLIYAPLIAIAIGLLGHLHEGRIDLNSRGFNYRNTFYQFFIASFTYAHIVLIYVRTHLNTKIFKLYPFRFVVVPILLVVAFTRSYKAAVLGSVIASWWDVYHSSAQTFGLGRIYDARAGNNPQVGRRADYLLNLLIYIGPILGGAVLIDHLRMLVPLGAIGFPLFTRIPIHGHDHAATISRIVVFTAVPCVVAYVAYYWRLSAQGYQVSPQKVGLYASTAFCTIFAWGFNPWATAFFIMNFFHALQYFAIVWFFERKSITEYLRLQDSKGGVYFAFAVYVVLALATGIVCEVGSSTNNRVVYVYTLMSSLMHFWADGFVWSVRKSQV